MIWMYTVNCGIYLQSFTTVRIFPSFHTVCVTHLYNWLNFLFVQKTEWSYLQISAYLIWYYLCIFTFNIYIQHKLPLISYSLILDITSGENKWPDSEISDLVPVWNNWQNHHIPLQDMKERSLFKKFQNVCVKHVLQSSCLYVSF
jgi:hypothetical protein